MGRDSSVGTAIRYELDAPGNESRWGARCSARIQTGPGAHPASYKTGTGSLSGGEKQPGRGVNDPPPCGAEVKERAEVYFYSPSEPSWSVLGRTYLTFANPLCCVSTATQTQHSIAGTIMFRVTVLTTVSTLCQSF